MKDLITSVYKSWLVYNQTLLTLKKADIRRVRCANFPETVSEYIVYRDVPNCRRDISTGDLMQEEKRIEVKCVNSSGPISFGPTEKWDILYIVVCWKQQKGKYRLLKIDIPNTDDIWKKINVSKADTFKTQTTGKRRPRLSLSVLLSQVEYTVEKRGSILDTLQND